MGCAARAESETVPDAREMTKWRMQHAGSRKGRSICTSQTASHEGLGARQLEGLEVRQSEEGQRLHQISHLWRGEERAVP